MDTLITAELPLVPRGNMRQPLLGLTVLLVEDSRYCSEAVRLLCVRSGARLRRADCRRAAYRHLATYRPSLVIVDIGLPDGSGLDLVRDLAAHRPNAPAILATSGDDPAISKPAAIRAGADGFLEKPLRDIRYFQQQILNVFPGRPAVDTTKIIPFRPEVEPDTLAIAEDLCQVAELVQTGFENGNWQALSYCAQFLRSLETPADKGGLANLSSQILCLKPGDGGTSTACADILKSLRLRAADCEQGI